MTGSRISLLVSWSADYADYEKQPVVPAAQDTTSLNYNTHPAANGLGPVCAKGTLGLLWLHDTMAFSVDGVPLGLLDVQCRARPEGKKEKKKTGDPGESGCKIEDRQLGNADRIESCLAMDMVAAWRVYHLTKLGRETPDVPCTVFFEEHEWKAPGSTAPAIPFPRKFRRR